MQLQPIVEKMYELNRWLLNKVGKFPRDQRFVLGQRLVNKSLDIQEKLVAAAVMKKGDEKIVALDEISVQLEQLRYLVRLARDGKCMNRKAWYFCSKELVEIGVSGDRKNAWGMDQDGLDKGLESCDTAHAGRFAVVGLRSGGRTAGNSPGLWSVLPGGPGGKISTDCLLVRPLGIRAGK